MHGLTKVKRFLLSTDARRCHLVTMEK